MEDQSRTSREADENGPTIVPSRSQLGIIGLILSISGLVVSLGSLLLFYYILLVGGGLDIMDYPTEEFTSAGYCGLLVGITGGVLGIVSMRRGENKTAASISIVLGAFMFCTCNMLTLLLLMP